MKTNALCFARLVVLTIMAGRCCVAPAADSAAISYVTVEIVDQDGAVVPSAENPVRFTVTGAGELAAIGSFAPNDAASFRLPLRKTYQGRALAILRPKGSVGKITLEAEAGGLKSATIEV